MCNICGKNPCECGQEVFNEEICENCGQPLDKCQCQEEDL